jgi:polyketide synthase PksN
VAEFWRALDRDQPCIREIPSQRFDWRATHRGSADQPTKGHTWWGGFIPEIEEFDPNLFGISEGEAVYMDPRQRLLLMSAYNAIEDAGYAPRSMKGTRTAVFIAAEDDEYLQKLQEAGIEIPEPFSHSAGMVANCISYYFDFQGPSEVVNTMCSGAAVAIHRAVQAVRSGEVDQALVGAANLILRPDLHISLSRLGQLSASPTVKSFGEGAAGYVRSEGVGIILIKPLAAAQAAEDAIYALIRNTAVNFNGQGGLSMASPNAARHAELIRECYESADVDPRDITYIEAQGMGNQVTDIAEWDACNRALKQLAATHGLRLENGQCRISSLKPMIGHMHSASALGALWKIIHSLRTERIHKILDFDKSNPFLNLTDQPCRLATETESWRKNDHPRIAGLHSFGSGGVNAHIAVEEYRPRNPIGASSRSSEFEWLPLSAATPALRMRMVERLDEALAEHPEYSLASIARTLRRGRDAMRFRVAFVADSVAKLVDQLRAYRPGMRAPDIYESPLPEFGRQFAQGSAPPNRAHQQAMEWVAATSSTEVANAAACAPRVHLPVYPFDKRRYWFDCAEPGRSIDCAPELDRNVEARNQFQRRIHPDDSIVRDHRVEGRKIFPAAAYIDLVIAAAEARFGAPVASINDIVWHNPLFVDEATVDIEVELSIQTGHSARFQVVSVSGDKAGPIVFSTGLIHSGSCEAKTIVDWSVIKNRCSRQLDSKSVYEALDYVGLNYGPAFRAILECGLGEGEAIARIKQPVTQAGGNRKIDPALLDSALQVGALLVAEQRRAAHGGSDLNGAQLIPFSVNETFVWGGLPPEFIVHSRISPDSTEQTVFVDSDLCDAEGRVLIALRGFHYRGSASSDSARVEMHVPVWVPKEVGPHSAFPLVEEPRWIAFCVGEQIVIDGGELVPIRHLSPADALVAVCDAITDKLRGGIAADTAHHFVIEVWSDWAVPASVCEGVVSWIRSVALEYPHIGGKVIRVETRGDCEAAAQPSDLAVRERFAPEAEYEVCYVQGKRYVRKATRVAALSPQFPDVLNHAGRTYCIVGGGQLGRQLAEWLVKNLDALVIVASRAPQSIGPGGRWVALDVTKQRSVEDFVARLADEHPDIEGFFFTAGVSGPGPMLEKSAENLRGSMGPKCMGALNLLEQCRELRCRFVALFSSQACQGELQNSDYAAANGFLNGLAQDFAPETSSQWQNRAGERISVVSINWPEWQAGGMKLVPEMRELLKRRHRLAPLPTAVGFDVLRQIIRSGAPRVAVQYRLVGGQIRAGLAGEHAQQAERIVRELLSGYLQRTLSASDMEAEFSDLGINSISVVNLIAILQRQYGIRVLPALLFEYSSPMRLQLHIAKLLRHDAGESVTNNPRQPKRHELRPGTGPWQIAVVGMDARFPGAKNVTEFWKNIVDGRRCITPAPIDERMSWSRSAAADAAQPLWGGFIDDIDAFDAGFFSLAPSEAELMDPQQRLLLQSVWSAIENGAMVPKDFARKTTGVFVAAAPGEYADVVTLPRHHPLSTSSVAASVAPGRISHLFNFNGPSEYCDTACSSVLVAVHRAIQSIRLGECEQAIVASINLLLSPEKFADFEAMDYLSPDGSCRPFQPEANGYVRAEGVGSIVLKPLERAIEDGDIVYGVIQGTGVFHGGRGLSLTSPSPNGMKQAILAAFHKAEIDPRTVSYVEMHGIGSPLSDSIEVGALQASFEEFEVDSGSTGPTISQQVCFLGSLKPCIGHGELVSGMGALIKVLCALRSGLIPGLPGFTGLHADISSAPSLGFSAQNQSWIRLTDVQGSAIPRRASVNSFGFSGVNAHVLVEEYVPLDRGANAGVASSEPHVIVLSAKNASRLQAVAEQLLSFLRDAEGLSLADVAYTLQVGRQAFHTRLAFVVDDLGHLINLLELYLTAPSDKRLHELGLYLGSADLNDDSAIGALSGAAEEAAVEVLLAAKAFDKVAQFWAWGGEVPWRRLHQAGARRIPLPGYVFAKDRYWLSTTADVSTDRPVSTDGMQSPPKVGMEECIRSFLASELKVHPDDLGEDTPLRDLGTDSILILRLKHMLRERFAMEVSARDLVQLETVAAIASYVSRQLEDVASGQRIAAAPELASTVSPSLDFLDHLEHFEQGILSLDEMEALIEGSAYDVT